MGCCCSKHAGVAGHAETVPSTGRTESFKRAVNLTVVTSTDAEFVPGEVRDLDLEESVCASPTIHSPSRRSRAMRNQREDQALQSILEDDIEPEAALHKLLDLLSGRLAGGLEIDDETADELETLRMQYLQFVRVEQMQACYADVAHKLSQVIQRCSARLVNAAAATMTAGTAAGTAAAAVMDRNRWYVECDNDEARVQRLQSAAQELCEAVRTICSTSVNCEALLCDLVKPQEAIEAKAARKYGGDATRVLDMVRASVICETLDDMDAVVAYLQHGIAGIHITRLKNALFDSDAPAHGYQDIKVNVWLPNSQVVGEIQLHLQALHSLFEDKGYELYQWRLQFQRSGLTCPRDYVSVLASAQQFSRLNFMCGQQVSRLQDMCAEDGSGDDKIDLDDCIGELSLLSHANAGVDRLSRALAVRMIQIRLIEHRVGASSMRLESSLYEAALLLVKMQRTTEAEQFLRKKLQLVQQICGQQSTAFTASMNSLGLVLRYQGCWSEAAKCYEQAINAERSARPNNPRVFQWSRNLAAMLQAQGEFNDAEVHLRRALTALESLDETWVPVEVTHCKEMLGMCLYRQGLFEDAERIWKEVLTWREFQTELQQTNAGKLATAQMRYKVGVALLGREQLEAARRYVEQAIDAAKEIGPFDSSELRIWLHTLAAVYLQQRKPADAERSLRRAISMTERAYGPDHPLLVEDLRELARCYDEAGKLSEAEACYERAVKCHAAALGSQDSQLVELLVPFTGVLQKERKYSHALQTMSRAIEVAQCNYGSTSPQLVPLLTQFAALLGMKGNRDREEKVLWRAAEIARSAPDAQSTTLMPVLGKLARFSREKQLDHEAMALYDEAVALAPEADDVDVADRWLYNECITMLTHYRIRFRDFQKAEQSCKQLVAIRARMYGKRHPNYAEALSTYATVLTARGRHAEAEQMLQQCKNIKVDAFGQDHFSLAETHLAIARAQQTCDKLTHAEFSIQQAVAGFAEWEGHELELCRALHEQASLLIGLGATERAKRSVQQLVDVLPRLKLVDVTKKDLVTWTRTCWRVLQCRSFAELPTEIHRLLRLSGVHVQVSALDEDAHRPLETPA